MLPTIVNSTDAWPLVVSTFHGTEHSAQVLDETLSLWFACFARGPHALIIDLSRGYAGTGARQRAQIGERVTAWMKDHRAELPRLVTLVLIFDNMLVRSIITGVSWLVPASTPYCVAPDLNRAVDLAQRELAKAGVVLPSALAAVARRAHPARIARSARP